MRRLKENRLRQIPSKLLIGSLLCVALNNACGGRGQDGSGDLYGDGGGGRSPSGGGGGGGDEPRNMPTRADCMVEGARYDHGESIPDPFSCNTCVCDNGLVSACTEIACAEPCPTGTGPGYSCGECGVADDCHAVETRCFTQCNEDAPCINLELACEDGICVNYCG
jgi:hypothetical protein